MRTQPVNPGTQGLDTKDPSLARILPFGIYIAFLARKSLAQALGNPGLFELPGMDGRWWYAVQVALVSLALVWYWKGYEEFRFPRPTGGEWGLALLAGVGVFVAWINMDAPWMSMGTPEPKEGFNPLDEGGAILWPLAVVRVAGAALVVPVMEELFWRSFILRWIANREFQQVAPQSIGLLAMPLWLSAALFGSEHSLWLAGILAGLVYGWLYLRTGKLWVPVVAHGLTNGLLGAWVLYTQHWQFW